MNKKWRGPTSAQVAALRRKLVSPTAAQKVGKARQIYAADLRSGWDSYEGAIAAARAGNVDRLVDCLRARKPMSDDDRDRLAGYIATRLRRRLWSPELVRALGPPTEDDYDLLADLVERTGRRRGGVSDEAGPPRSPASHSTVVAVAGSGAGKTARRGGRLRVRDRGLSERRRDRSDRVRNVLDHPKTRGRKR